MDIAVISGIICFATAIFTVIYNVLNCINASTRLRIKESLMDYNLSLSDDNKKLISYCLKPYLTTIWYAWIHPKYCMISIKDCDKIEPYYRNHIKEK